MTAGEVATATGTGPRQRQQHALKVAKSGELTKAARGYQLAGKTPPDAAADADAGAEPEQPAG